MKRPDAFRSMLAAAAAALLAGCSTGPAEDGAILRPVCAPNDAVAVQLVVPASSSDFPQLRFWAWRSSVEGTTVTVGSDGQAGTAAWCTADRVCQEPIEATAAFGKIRPDLSIDVAVDARLPDGTRFRETRRAKWVGAPILCV